jgi:hypothetical protein
MCRYFGNLNRLFYLAGANPPWLPQIYGVVRYAQRKRDRHSLHYPYRNSATSAIPTKQHQDSVIPTLRVRKLVPGGHYKSVTVSLLAN